MDVALIAARALHFAAQISLAGCFAFIALVARPVFAEAGGAVSSALRHRLAIIAWASLILALLSSLPWLFLVARDMSGQPIYSLLPNGVLTTVLTKTRFGHGFLLRLALIVALVPFVTTIGKHAPRDGLAAILAALLLGATAWEGHAGAEEGIGGTIHLAADAMHFVAAGFWLGALLPLAALLVETGQDTGRHGAFVARGAAARFSTLGVLCVATLIITGGVNSWFLVGTIAGLVGTTYGQLLLAKLALFAVMLGLAAVNRFVLLPRLATSDHGRKAVESRQAVASIARHAVLETCLGLAIVALVAALGTQFPAAHEQPWWPFRYRLGLDAVIADPTLRNDAIGTAIIGGLGLLLLVYGWYRRRVIAIVTGMVLFLGLGWRPIQLLLLDATPTSYYASSEPYSVASILTGRAIYAANCVACHGESGQGDGPASASLAIAPADLTAHLFVHTEGDLFWFIGNGMDDGVMPPFRDVLAESQRWSLINFLKAHAARFEADTIGAEVTEAPAPQAPDFSFTDSDGAATTLAAALTQRAVLLIIGEAPSSPRLAQLEEWRSVLAESGVALVISNDPDLQAVYESFDRRRARDDRPIEFLIDHDGNIRALARPGDTPDWSDLAVLTREIDTMARLKIARRSQAAHVHTIN